MIDTISGRSVWFDVVHVAQSTNEKDKERSSKLLTELPKTVKKNTFHGPNMYEKTPN